MSPGAPRTVNAGPHTRWPGSSGLIAAGSAPILPAASWMVDAEIDAAAVNWSAVGRAKSLSEALPLILLFLLLPFSTTCQHESWAALIQNLPMSAIKGKADVAGSPG